MSVRVRTVAGVLLGIATFALVLGAAYRPVVASQAVGWLAAGVAATLAAVVVGLAVRRPWPALLLWVAVGPIINVARADLWVGPIQLLPGTAVIVVLGLGAWLNRERRVAADAPTWLGGRTRLVLAAAALLAVAATLVAPSRDLAVNITLHGLLEPMAVFGVVVALRPSAGQALDALLALAIGVALATVVNLVWLLVVVTPTDFYEQRHMLARLTYFNVGIFGSMLVMAIPAAASLLFVRHRVPAPRLAAAAAMIAVALMLVGLFLTYTKSAWLSAALVSSLMIVLLVRRWRARIPLLLAIAILLAVVVPYPLPVLRALAPPAASAYEAFIVATQGEGRIESWDPDTYQGSGSIGIRLEAVGAAAELTARSPLLGVGPGHFQAEFASIRPDANVPELQSAHNLLPNLAAEYGLPFALLVAAGLLWAMRLAFGARGDADAVRRVAGTAVGLCLVGFLAMATLFGIDLYRTYRTMNTDVLTAGLLVGLAVSVGLTRLGRSQPAAATASSPEPGEPIHEPMDLRPTGEEEVADGRT